MDPELNKRLGAIEDSLRKNHQLLVRIRRVQRNAGLFRLFYWLVIILIGFGAFYFIQPYIQAITKTYGDLQNSIPDLRNFSNFIQQVNGKKQ